MGKPTPQISLLVTALTIELKHYVRITESGSTIVDTLFSEMLVEVLIEICQNFLFDANTYEAFEFLWRAWKYQNQLNVNEEMLAMVPVSLEIIKIHKITVDCSSAFAGGLCKINQTKYEQTQNMNKTEIQTNQRNMSISKILRDFVCFVLKKLYTAM